MPRVISKTKKISKKPNVVVIGGGTGSFIVLSGLRDKPVNLTSLVTMMDSGGSTGRLRDQLGVLPPGDLRQSLVALSKTRRVWRDLFLYRFDNGDFDGHNFGNVFLSALEKMTGSIESALELASDVLHVQGKVLPVTLDNSHLCVRLQDGTIIKGEAYIDIEEANRPKIVNSFLNPSAHANPNAVQAIMEADFIVMGPGDLYTSLIPNFLVEGISEALSASTAKTIFISNLMTKTGQTDSYSVSDYVTEVLKYSKKTHIDHVLVNTAVPSGESLVWYEQSKASLVRDDLAENLHPVKNVIRGDYISDIKYKKTASDKLKRSLLRHDSKKLASEIMRILAN